MAFYPRKFAGLRIYNYLCKQYFTEILRQWEIVTKEQIITRLDQFFETNDRLLSRDMKALFGLTQYMANKWLEKLCTQAPPYLRVEKVSHVSIKRRIPANRRGFFVGTPGLEPGTSAM